MNNENSAVSKNMFVVVLGAGESGTGAAILAKKQGFDVLVSDSGCIQEKYRKELCDLRIPFEENGHSVDKLLNANLIVKSPGIPGNIPLIQKLKSHNIPVVSEIEFAAPYTNAKKICITGSNGKSTTTMLTYHILKNAGLKVGLAGNIGRSFARQVAEEDFQFYVLEISSFMLDDMYDFKAEIAVLLNITPDHLDRYEYKMERYVDSKFRILQNQTGDDVFIYCADDLETVEGLKRHFVKANQFSFSIRHEVSKGAYLKQDELIIRTGTKEDFSMALSELALQGKHNIYNSMASGIVSRVLDLRKESIRESMGDFKNIEHRLEHVAYVSGINFINDSKATNVNSTWYALESMSDGVVLILGGVDKGNDYEMLRPLVRQKVKAIVCMGVDNKAIHDAFEEDVELIVNTKSAKDAVEVAYHLAKKGDTVLLSPACASFDLFKNYEDRGNQFKAAVREL